MAKRASSVVATAGRRPAAAFALACMLLSACGQKGALIAARPAARPLPPASSPDTLPIPGVSPADLPAPAPRR